MQKQLAGLLIAVVFTLAGLVMPQWFAADADKERTPAALANR